VQPRQQELTVTGGTLVAVKSVRVPAAMMKNTAAIERTTEGLLESASRVLKNMKTAPTEKAYSR